MNELFSSLSLSAVFCPRSIQFHFGSIILVFLSNYPAVSRFGFCHTITNICLRTFLDNFADFFCAICLFLARRHFSLRLTFTFIIKPRYGKEKKWLEFQASPNAFTCFHRRVSKRNEEIRGACELRESQRKERILNFGFSKSMCAR